MFYIAALFICGLAGPFLFSRAGSLHEVFPRQPFLVSEYSTAEEQKLRHATFHDYCVISRPDDIAHCLRPLALDTFIHRELRREVFADEQPRLYKTM